MRRHVLAALVLAAAVVGCGGQAPTPTVEPSTSGTSDLFEPTIPPDDLAEAFSQHIEGTYCVGKTKEAWCPYVKRSKVTEDFVFVLHGPTASVVLTATDRKKARKLALALCRDLVDVESSDVVPTFGFEHFTVFDRRGSKELANCDVR